MERPSDEENHRLDRLAAQVEPDLYGLTVLQARDYISQHPGLSLLAVGSHEVIPAIYRPGEVVVYVENDLIVDPDTIEEHAD